MIVAVAALGVSMASCGSTPTAREHAEIDARLNVIDRATPDDAGSDQRVDIGADAKGTGERMRSSAAHPGAPR